MSNKTEPDIWARLREPFRIREVKWRVGSVARDGGRANLLCYVDARCVQDRLDEVVGAGNWRNSFKAGPLSGVLCRLEIRHDGEWIWKEDGADGTQIEATKGGYSDAFKRAAVPWGIGRYLYRVPAPWVSVKSGRSPAGAVSITQRGKGYVGYCDRPPMPKWALHSKDQDLKTQPRSGTEPDANRERQAAHDPSWRTSAQGWRQFCENDLSSNMDEIADFLSRLKKKRPSNMTEPERTAEAKWLKSEEGRGRLASYRAWKAN